MPDITAPSKPLGYTEHIDFDSRRIIAGEPVTIDGHTFLVQSMNQTSWGEICKPHPGSSQDTFGIANRVEMKLDHAPWRGCPALDPETSPFVQVSREVFNALVEVAEYVSCGRSAVGHQPVGAPYPDALARRTLGALGDAGLHRPENER